MIHKSRTLNSNCDIRECDNIREYGKDIVFFLFSLVFEQNVHNAKVIDKNNYRKATNDQTFNKTQLNLSQLFEWENDAENELWEN